MYCWQWWLRILKKNTGSSCGPVALFWRSMFGNREIVFPELMWSRYMPFLYAFSFSSFLFISVYCLFYFLVLQLGAGTSLPGLVAAKVGSNVTLTDDSDRVEVSTFNLNYRVEFSVSPFLGSIIEFHLKYNVKVCLELPSIAK